MQAAPLSIVILEVLKHTPAYVWGILLALIVLGGLQMRDQVLGRARVMAMPVVFAAYSLWGVAATFRLQFDVLAAWALGMGVMLWAARWIQWPRHVEFLPERNAFAVSGSIVPLLVMLAVFAVRYVVVVNLILHPAWRDVEAVTVLGSLVYGLLSGVFAMRARTILSHATGGLRLSPA